jgi:hypothetical protein
MAGKRKESAADILQRILNETPAERERRILEERRAAAMEADEQRKKAAKALAAMDPTHLVTGKRVKKQSMGKGGSPPIHDWSRIEPVIDWYLANRKHLREADFVEAVRDWCRQETGAAPHARTILKRLQKRAALLPKLRPITPSSAQ